ncbi:zinc finger protein 708-like isoform X2 [Prorops nasuta]
MIINPSNIQSKNYIENNTSLKHLERRGQIDLIEMQVDHDISRYKYFFVYKDLDSSFVVLRAVHNNNEFEIASKLLDILIIIGVPQVLQSVNGSKFAKSIVHQLRNLWKDIAIMHEEMNPISKNNVDFKDTLQKWIKNNPSENWHRGLKFLQVLHNSTFCTQSGKTPYNLLLKKNVNICVYKRNQDWTAEKTDSLEEHKKINNDSELKVEHMCESPLKNDINCELVLDVSTGDYSSDCNKNESTEENNGNDFNFINVVNELTSNINHTMYKGEKKLNTEFADQIIPSLKCKVCNKEYIKQGHLKNHLKTHSKNNVKFECTLCYKSFQVLTLYEKHMHQSHKEKRSLRNNCLLKQDTVQNPNKMLQYCGLQNQRQQGIEESPKHITAYEECNNQSVEIMAESSSRSKKESKNGASKDRRRRNDNPTLVCSFCKQKFHFPSVLKRHMRSHTNERPYVCDICNKSFKQLGHLSQHSLTHKDYRSFQCAACGVKFESLDNLKLHTQSHKDDCLLKTKEVYRLFECDDCKKVFTTKSVLERHIFTHTHERQFGCKVCGKRFKQAGHVKSHMLVHTGERKFECKICSKKFSLSNSLKKHMYVHNGEKPYQCDICGARFLEKRNLNGHLMTHTNERPFSCKICGKRYTLADTLRRHISASHEDGRTYQCEICAKMFKQLAHLSVHKKVHNDERPFQCHLCAKNFKHKNVLKSHLAIHANIRPFECDVCKSKFVRKTNLQTHIASAHMNERPYTCTICGKRFKQISHLNGHVVVHSNSMPYQCDYCDRRCNRLDNLKKHMRLHTKNKQ